MKLNSIFKKYIFMTIIILFCSLIVNIAAMAISNTYSWFFDSKAAVLGASVGKAEDIIKVEIVCADNNDNVQPPVTIIPRPSNLPEIINPKQIIVTKISSKSTPNIYFDITGELANYILQVHPVDFIDTNNNSVNIEHINIVANSNMVQGTNLGRNKDSYTTGKLYIKYLNGFINESFDIKYRNGNLANQSSNSNINNN